eukprot:TRINITY_DN31512_c0_g1_i1.p1 TRINITY_DN31512_c0_g1~~TRINITY_DN31512_c0_g1_i1.p1  ORF type:complete len:305 (+),score=27.76 TRINITY_DN31512_c0_g1_i1:80-994(+)
MKLSAGECMLLALSFQCVCASVMLLQTKSARQTDFVPMGANYSPCLDQSQCRSNRDCLTTVSLTAPVRCTPGKYCTCVPRAEGSWRCSPNGSCDEFETCMPTPSFFPPDRVCVDNSQIETLRDEIFCKDDSVCKPSSRICVVVAEGLGVCAAPLPPRSNTVAEAEQSDVITASADEKLDGVDDPAEQEHPSKTACIAAHHLEELREQNVLLYAADKTAHVLCDANDSCATTGHMVLFNGRSMMMKSYCAIVGCELRVAKVNSLRWSFASRVASHTEQLLFSTLSARFATRGEEALLSIAIRLGL